MKNKKRSIPKHNRIIEEKDCKIIIYVDDKTLSAKCFIKKQVKPKFYIKFQTKESIKQYIDEFIHSEKAYFLQTKKFKEEQAEKTKALIKNIKVDDIFKCSWGYDQTNNDYYQVVKVNKKTATFRQIRSTKRWTHSMSGSERPDWNDFIETAEPFTKVIKARIKLNSYSSMTKWDGEENYFSEYA